MQTTDGIQRNNNNLSPSSFSNPCPAHRTTGATGTSAYSQPSTIYPSKFEFVVPLEPGKCYWKKNKLGGGRKPATKKKLPTWSHTFVCLSNSSQDTLPGGEERAALQIAGLGEKMIHSVPFRMHRTFIMTCYFIPGLRPPLSLFFTNSTSGVPMEQRTQTCLGRWL